jgi:hypothetical protein
VSSTAHAAKINPRPHVVDAQITPSASSLPSRRTCPCSHLPQARAQLLRAAGAEPCRAQPVPHFPTASLALSPAKKLWLQNKEKEEQKKKKENNGNEEEKVKPVKGSKEEKDQI